MPKLQKLVLCCMICIVGLGLAACFPHQVTRADIIGLWIERQNRLTTASNGGPGRFEFFPDGRFNASNIPREYFIWRGVNPERVDATGLWKLYAPASDPLGNYYLQLNFKPFKGYPLGAESKLLIAAEGGDITLFAWIGDESNQIIFAKKQ